MMVAPRMPWAGVGKPPREETAGAGVERFGARYGDLIAAKDVGRRSGALVEGDAGHEQAAACVDW